jgi:choline dehydrogenase-like flavoprotein
MATNLRKTDVVIVGLGAVGGVAALPLAQAGLEVIGLEAGTWLTPRDFAPDELRNNFQLAAVGAEGQQRDSNPSAERVGALFATAADPSDDECGRRHHATLLGAELAAQSVGFQGR